jgi:acyl-CoA synthetase (AMP-forming)/AMP-acid ligase II
VIDLVAPDIVIGDGTHQVAIADLVAQRPAPGDHPEDPMVDENDPQVIFCTSGSTGEPKGVVLSQRTQRIRAMIEAPSHPVGPTVCMFPFFHMAGWQLTTAALLSGEEVVLVTRPDADELLEAIDRRRAAHLYAVPAVWRRILEADRAPYDLSSLVSADTGTSAVTVDLLKEIAVSFPRSRTTVTYGSTEAGLVCRLGPEDLFTKPGSVGPPGIGVHTRLDEDGQLLVASPYLMSGYLGDDQASEAALAGGWFHTGDLASRDADGYFTIIGRVQDVIRTGGETVAPVEVDAVLATHPALADAVVAGVPDDDWGEVVTAFVQPRRGQAITLEDLRAYCEGRLAPYKIPRRMLVVDHIPRTNATLQVERRRLSALGTRAPREP